MLISNFNEPAEFDLIGDDELGLSFEEAKIIPIIIIMDVDTNRPKEIDIEEFANSLDASWVMTFIDTDDHKYNETNFEEIANIGLRHCTEEDLHEFSDLIGDTFHKYPKAMLCVNNLDELRIRQKSGKG